MLEDFKERHSPRRKYLVGVSGGRDSVALLELLVETYGSPAAARPRSEHTQHLLPADIARFGSLGVVASMQPFHKADDGRYAESYIGSARSRSSYAFRSLLDAGAVVAFGSDWPVVTVSPFRGIEAAATGRTLDGTPWQTQESMSLRFSPCSDRKACTSAAITLSVLPPSTL